MPRAQDILFVVWGVAVVALIALRLKVVVFALVGAFVCGSIYVLAGMIPSRHESFGHRAFTTVFLAVVLSSLVLILPGTFGARRPLIQDLAVATALLLPLFALGFEIARTPRVLQTILRSLRQR